MKITGKRTLILFIGLFFVLSGIFYGCGSMQKASSSASTKSVSNSNASSEKGDGQSFAGSVADKAQTEGASKVQAVKLDSKIIKNGSIAMEAKDFTAAVNAVTNKAAEFGGYVESSNITGTSINNNGTYQNRNAHIKIRIPKDYFVQFITDAGKIGNVTQSSTSSENVTYQYYDNEAHLKALTVEEDRLLELLKKTGELKDIIELEKELANVRYQIENLTTTLKKLDNLVDYSSIDVNITEVQEIQVNRKQPVTLWDKIISGFIDSVKFMGSAFKGILICGSYILPFALIAVPVYFFVKRVIMKKRKKDNT